MKLYIICVLLIISWVPISSDWTRTARIADVDFWPDFTEEEIKEGIDHAHQQGLSVIMAWVTSENIDIPQKDLDALKKAVTYTHETYPDMRIIVYQAPLEIITENVDKNRDSILDRDAKAVSTEHPEWLQVGLDGRKAVFYGDFEFWIGKHDEDVWCCPNDPIYKEKIKESIQRLAETGIDGIWIDVVRFLCNYGDWEDNWACHCEDCEQKFTEDTGGTIPDTVTWDTTWKTWVVWRQQCIVDYIEELSQTAKGINPDIQIIVEHWHGFDAEATEDAWSPIALQTVADVLAHEYVSASEYVETYTPAAYVRDQAVYTYYRGVDTVNPSWMLVYSQREDGQHMLAASVLQAGCNFYDTVVPDMDDSVSLKERTRIFQWLTLYSRYYYTGQPVSATAVYYSKATIDFFDCPSGDWEFYREFTGISMMLLQLHVPYTVLTDLHDITQFDVLILPDVVCLSDGEQHLLQQFLDDGGYIVATGKTGYLDEMGWNRHSALIISGNPRYYSTERLFGNQYYYEVNPFFYPEDSGYQGTGDSIRREFLAVLDQVPHPGVTALGNVVVSPYIQGNFLVYRVVNFEGISPGNAVPDPQVVSITPPGKIVNAFFVPFLQAPHALDVAGSTVSVPVEDHCLVVVEVEPVNIFCNEHDYPAAHMLASFLQARGIPVQFVTSPEESSVLIVFGGHKAEKTGEFVSTLLTDEQKTQLNQPGFAEVFTFHTDSLIIIIAGNQREDTARQTKEARRTILELID